MLTIDPRELQLALDRDSAMSLRVPGAALVPDSKPPIDFP
jgi:hypothetical protein